MLGSQLGSTASHQATLHAGADVMQGGRTRESHAQGAPRLQEGASLMPENRRLPDTSDAAEQRALLTVDQLSAEVPEADGVHGGHVHAVEVRAGIQAERAVVGKAVRPGLEVSAALRVDEDVEGAERVRQQRRLHGAEAVVQAASDLRREGSSERPSGAEDEPSLRHVGPSSLRGVLGFFQRRVRHSQHTTPRDEGSEDFQHGLQFRCRRRASGTGGGAGASGRPFFSAARRIDMAAAPRGRRAAVAAVGRLSH
eukprot:scaffold47_cov258-Pinguiococcus_pyrenoidosus.AAC.13